MPFPKRNKIGSFPQAQKTAVCLNCGYTHGQSIKTDCKKCKKISCVHVFDSMGEANRYLNLRNDAHISDLIVQPKYDLYTVRFNYCESWAGKTPTLNLREKDKFKPVKAAQYTADFQYFDTRRTSGWVIEDYKPYNRIKKSPLITTDVSLRLNWLHKQLGHVFDVVASCYTGKMGYMIKEIKPRTRK